VSNTIQIKFLSSYGPYRPGDRTGFVESKVQDLENQGVKLKRLTTQTTSTSKSDPEARQNLSDMAKEQRIEQALEADDYHEMRKVLADVSNRKATGDHDEIRRKLEVELESRR